MSDDATMKIVRQIEVATAKPMPAHEAIDLLENLRSEIDAMIDGLRDDLKHQ
jgi:hypothetical protein